MLVIGKISGGMSTICGRACIHGEDKYREYTGRNRRNMTKRKREVERILGEVNT